MFIQSTAPVSTLYRNLQTRYHKLNKQLALQFTIVLMN